MLGRRWLPLAVVLAATSLAPRARAAEGDTCVAAYEGAQQRLKRGELLRARAELDVCLGSCPEALAKDCAIWREDVAGRLARVTFDVRQGGVQTPVADVRVSVDGSTVPVDTRGVVEVDPGPHAIEVSTQGASSETQSVDLPPGGATQLRFDFVGRQAESGSLPPAAIAIGAVGVAALLVGGGLGLAGHLQVSELRDTCAPDCARADVDAVRSEWIAGGVTAGVGVGALVVALAMVLGDDDDAVEAARAVGPALRGSHAGTRLGVSF